MKKLKPLSKILLSKLDNKALIRVIEERYKQSYVELLCLPNFDRYCVEYFTENYPRSALRYLRDRLTDDDMYRLYKRGYDNQGTFYPGT